MTTPTMDSRAVDQATGEYSSDLCIHQLFEAQVERTPEATAVICEDRQFTYHELNVRANQLAHHLHMLGVGPEVMVGLNVERSLDMLVGLFAILKAGGTYVPLDPVYPPERLAFMLEDTQAFVLITQQSLIETLPEQRPRLVRMDGDRDLIAQQSGVNPISEVMGEHLAYVLYTSGSTGRPKGVLIEHHALVSQCLAMIDAQELTAEDGTVAFSTLCFDVSLEQMLPALLVGARVVVRGQEMWTPADLLRQIKKHRLTVVNLPTAYWHQVLSEWAIDPQQLVDHPLRLLLTGGDRFPVEMARLWRQTPLRSARFFNGYGPTEATITATLFDVPRDIDEAQPEKSILIGLPFPNHTIHLLDTAGQSVPIGEVGELHIGGRLLARGYLNRPELTKERFIPDPFSQQPEARLYKTGDLARYLPDGTIEFLGRVDQQVKIHDRRIELGEIEAAISQHAAVRQAVVIAREDRPGDKRLVAYVVLHKEQVVTVEELKNCVMQILPTYMVPSAFLFLEELPLTSNAKVDRRALPAPESDRFTAKDAFVAPTLPLHHQLVQIWEDLLNVRPIGITDDFFGLGGHSLLAISLFDRIERSCGKKLPVSVLFAGATIEQLTVALTGETPPQPDDSLPFIALQVDGSRRPFFYLHGHEKAETTLHCYPLARALGADQPFYGLFPYNMANDLRRGHMPSMEEVAAAHIKTIRAIQPEGPYFLGGYCTGGRVIYEMGRQLCAEGQNVNLIVSIEPDFLVYALPYRVYYAAFQLIGKLFRLSEIRQVYWALDLKHIARRLFYKILRKTDPYPLTFAQLHEDYGRLCDWLTLGYRPSGGYKGKHTFFWAQEGEVAKTLRTGWRKVEANGNVEIHSVPGTHGTCKREYVSVLAEHLADCIQRAQQS